MSLEIYPFRKVIHWADTSTRYNRRGEGSRWFTLECGHTTAAKQSEGHPQKKRCRDCYYDSLHSIPAAQRAAPTD